MRDVKKEKSIQKKIKCVSFHALLMSRLLMVSVSVRKVWVNILMFVNNVLVIPL